MIYDLKIEIATRIANKSYLLRQVLLGVEVNTREYIIISALKDSIVQNNNTLSTKELENKLKEEYSRYLCNSCDDLDLLDMLIDLEREEALTEIFNEDTIMLGMGEIGL